MSAKPHIILGILVRNQVKREFLNFAQAWSADVTTFGFSACIHENFINGGEHEVTMVGTMQLLIQLVVMKHIFLLKQQEIAITAWSCLPNNYFGPWVYPMGFIVITLVR